MTDPRERRWRGLDRLDARNRPPRSLFVALLLISGSQFMLFAMWFDMESNKDLGGRGRRRTD